MTEEEEKREEQERLRTLAVVRQIAAEDPRARRALRGNARDVGLWIAAFAVVAVWIWWGLR